MWRNIDKFSLLNWLDLFCCFLKSEFVCVVWTDELTGAVEQENFLLDKGRLKLKTIQQAFSASLVRMCIGIS